MDKVRNSANSFAELTGELSAQSQQLLNWVFLQSPRRGWRSEHPASLGGRRGYSLTSSQRRLIRGFSRSKGWFFAFAVAVWGAWHGRLLVSTGLGVAVMVLIYRMQSWNWPALKAEFGPLFQGSNRQLAMAAGGGGLATVSAYLAISLWVEAENPWLASGMILQTVIGATVLMLLLMQATRTPPSLEEMRFPQLLADLTETDPLKRLIAVRQITRFVVSPLFDSVTTGQTDALPVMTRPQVAECFRLMLGRETETAVRNALLDGLQVLDNLPQLGQGTPPISIATQKHQRQESLLT